MSWTLKSDVIVMAMLTTFDDDDDYDDGDACVDNSGKRRKSE